MEEQLAGSERRVAALERVKPALFTFLEREGVEPTDNRAERTLRRAVLLSLASPYWSTRSRA